MYLKSFRFLCSLDVLLVFFLRFEHILTHILLICLVANEMVNDLLTLSNCGFGKKEEGFRTNWCKERNQNNP